MGGRYGRGSDARRGIRGSKAGRRCGTTCRGLGPGIEDEQNSDEMLRLDRRIESVQFKTWQVLKEGSYDMGGL